MALYTPREGLTPAHFQAWTQVKTVKLHKSTRKKIHLAGSLLLTVVRQRGKKAPRLRFSGLNRKIRFTNQACFYSEITDSITKEHHNVILQTQLPKVTQQRNGKARNRTHLQFLYQVFHISFLKLSLYITIIHQEKAPWKGFQLYLHKSLLIHLFYIPIKRDYNFPFLSQNLQRRSHFNLQTGKVDVSRGVAPKYFFELF